jgi:hypothetical protein
LQNGDGGNNFHIEIKHLGDNIDPSFRPKGKINRERTIQKLEEHLLHKNRVAGTSKYHLEITAGQV